MLFQSSDTSHAGNVSSILQDGCHTNEISLSSKNSEAINTPKLNIPGTSVIVSESDSAQSLEPYPLPIITAENLRPYPPGLITVVKEGPVQESSSSMLFAAIERELQQDLESSQLCARTTSMAPNYECKK